MNNSKFDIDVSAIRDAMRDTQNARLYREVRDFICVLSPARVISCGWNSTGMGKARGYEIEEILLVNHGAAHNDTIVMVERKPLTPPP